MEEKTESKVSYNNTEPNKPSPLKKNYNSLNPLIAPKPIAIKISNTQNVSSKKSCDNLYNKGGEYALHQIFQQRRQSLYIKRLDVKSNSNLSIISIKSAEIESFRNNEKIKEDDNNHIMTKEEEINLRFALSNHFVFRDITVEVLNSCINQCIFCTFSKNKIIYKEGEEGNFFYVISKGKIEATEKNKFKKKYKEWDCFGELSLITQQKREETVKCLEDVELFSFDGIAFRDTQKRMNEQILKERFDFLNNIFIFKCLDSISKYNVAQRVILKIFNEGNQIIKMGEEGETLYIIKEGLVSCRIGDNEVRQLKVHDYFGLNAILINAKRGMDIFALEKTTCFELSEDELIEALGQNYIDILLFCFFKNCIEQCENLKIIFPDILIDDLFKLFITGIYSKDEKIYDENNTLTYKKNPKRIIFVIEGSIYKNNELIANKGDCIGKEFFEDYKKPILENLKVFPDLISLEADILSISNLIKIDLNGEKPLNLLNRLGKLKKLTLFKNLSDKILESIASKLKKKRYEENEIIVHEGEKGEKLFLISKGRVKISKEGVYIRELEAGNCFGENVLFMNHVKRTATVTAIDKVVCYLLFKTDFDVLLKEQNVKNYLLKKFALQDTSITLKDLHYIKFLGKGKFGSVSLVHNHKNIYAIKAISRKSVEKQKMLAKYFVYERRVMLTLDHPFIAKMVKSMKNNLFCFLLIEYVNGKNLSEYLSNRLSFKNIFETQFYIGSMLLMLEYLQKKYIAHRDIKPANIMIDTNGYLKMIDFGTAKVLIDYTSTVIGTPHYIAPEILQGKGYSLSCDFWSVGICMYEIFYGVYPFGNHAHEVIEIYKEVLHKDFNFPDDNTKFKNVNDFINNLLTKKVNKRNCNINNLKQMKFFEDFDFEKLNDFEYTPNYIPPNVDLNKYLKINSPYENIVSHENISNSSTIKKGKKDYVPPDYDKNWADEF